MSADTPRPVSAKLKGRFITLEGGEGTGKSTQIKRLVARLVGMGIETLATREPGGSPKAERLRDIILSGGVQPFGPVAETLAFAAARIDHLDHTIRPALEEGCFVLCDRFMDSTRAYQGALGDVDPDIIDQLEIVAVGDTRPDLTIILDIDPAVGMERANKRRQDENADRFEAQDLQFHSAVRDAFRKIANAEPARCAIVDASATPDEVEAHIWKLVDERILKRKAAGDHFRKTQDGPTLRVIEGSRGKTAEAGDTGGDPVRNGKNGRRPGRSRRPPGRSKP